MKWILCVGGVLGEDLGSCSAFLKCKEFFFFFLNLVGWLGGQIHAGHAQGGAQNNIQCEH